MHAIDLPDQVEPIQRDFTLHGSVSQIRYADVAEDASGLSPEAIDVLHRAWFSIGSESSEEGYRRPLVPFAEVLDHLEDAFELDTLPTEELRIAAIGRIAENLEDVMLAISCMNGRSSAWLHLENEIAPLLARMCELRVDEAEAMLHAARFLRTVRDRTHQRTEAIETGIVIDLGIDDPSVDDGTPCLQDYVGLHPLRSYLGGPLFAMLQDLIRDGLVVATGRLETRTPVGRRLRLAD